MEKTSKAVESKLESVVTSIVDRQDAYQLKTTARFENIRKSLEIFTEYLANNPARSQLQPEASEAPCTLEEGNIPTNSS